MLSDADLLVFPEHILIDAEPEVHNTLWAHLDHYIIADDVTLHDDTETTFCLGIEGPKAKEMLCAAGAPAPANHLAHERWLDLTVAHASATGAPGYRIFGPAERKRAVMDQLYLLEASPDDWEIVRLENARPGLELISLLPTSPPNRSETRAAFPEGLLPRAGDRGACAIARPH